MSPFPLPIMFTAWVWQDGAGIAGEVIRRAKLGGFKTVAVQLSRQGGDPGSSLDPQDVQYLHDAGLFVVGWDPVGGDTLDEIAKLKLDGWMPQVEGDAQREALLALPWPDLPRALVTTYGGLDTPAKVAQVAGAFGLVLVECYAADGPIHADIPRMLSQGAVYGFDRTRLRALCGTYQGEGTANYPGLSPANYGGIYLEESTTDAQLRAFGAIVPTEEEPPVSIPDPATINKKIAALADSWLSCFTDPKTLTRLRSIKRIATTTDPEWVAARQDVVDSLDGKVAALRAQITDLQNKLASESAARVQATSALNDALARIAAAQKALL